MIGHLTANVTPHKHCLVCGSAVGKDESFCDELCESKYKSAKTRQKILFLVFAALFLVILILPSLLNMEG
jgi:predicted nucleic acid-binding Zn ribbon protein